MIRPARAVNIPSIIELLKTAHAKSRHAVSGKVDETRAKQLLQMCVMRHGGKGESGTHFMIAMRDGRVEGLHIGIKQAIGVVGDKFFATDMLFHVSGKAEPFDALALIRSFMDWTKQDPRIIEIMPGTHDLMPSWEIAGRIYQKMGFIECGKFYRKDVDPVALRGAA